MSRERSRARSSPGGGFSSRSNPPAPRPWINVQRERGLFDQIASTTVDVAMAVERFTSVFLQMPSLLCEPIFEATEAMVKYAVITTCTFENDTQYPVEIVGHHDGTRTLNPTESQGNYLVRGFSVDLIMELPEGKEVKINFPSSRFENRRHKMSVIFRDHINELPLEVLKTTSSWKFLTNHPGGFEMKVEMTSKHSWKKKQDIGAEGEAKIGAMIKAIELSSSFKLNTKLSQVDECEQQITESSVRTFKDRCYLWQETVVIETNQPRPYDVLKIPTPHTEMTTTPSEPGKDMAIYAR